MLTKIGFAGNIRVFCRIRPIITGENFGHFRPLSALDSSNVLLQPADSKGKTYSFDKVFCADSSQGACRAFNFLFASHFFYFLMVNK